MPRSLSSVNRLLDRLTEESTTRLPTTQQTEPILELEINDSGDLRWNDDGGISFTGNGRRYSNFNRYNNRYNRYNRYNIPPAQPRINNHSINISINFNIFLENVYSSDDVYIYTCKSMRILSEFLLNKRKDYNFQDLNKGIFKGVKSISELPDGYVSLNGNQKIKLGRILNGINKMIHNKDTYKDSYYIEKVINEYKSWNYDSAVMRNSCMNNMHGYLTLYTQNEDKISLLVLIDKKSGLILGRALTWELDNSPYIYMDRIYSAKDDIQNIFIKYARRNKMIYRTSRAEDNFMLYVPNGDKYEKMVNTKYKMNVKLNTKGVKYYPYFDSLYIKTKSKTFTNKLGFNIIIRYNTMRRTGGNISKTRLKIFSKR